MKGKWIDQKVEEQVIGSILSKLGAMDISLLKAEYFTNNTFRTIFEHAWQLWVEGSPVDLVSISGSLGKAGLLDFMGGMSYLSKMATETWSPAEDKHCRILQEYWQRRETDRILSSAHADLEKGVPVLDIIGTLDHKAFHVIQDNGKKNHLDKESDLEDVLDAILNPKPDDCVPTPWPSIDEMIGGYRPEELIIMAGRPGMGKTAMMVTAQRNLALRGIASLSFSMDMGRRQLWNRYYSQEANIPVNQLERAINFSNDVKDRLYEARDQLIQLPFWVDSHPYRTLSDIRMISRQMVIRNKVKVVFLDHIGKIRPEKSETRQEEVSKIAQGLKGLAKEFGLTVVALVQLNRMVEMQADKRPMMSHLRESGSIEQEADIILLNYRPEYYEMDTFPSGTPHGGKLAHGKVEIIGAKVRNGEASSRVLDFQGEYTLITEPELFEKGQQMTVPIQQIAVGL